MIQQVIGFVALVLYALSHSLLKVDGNGNVIELNEEYIYNVWV